MIRRGQTIFISIEKDIALVRMTNGVTNAISMALVNDLDDVVDRVKRECKGMVLAGGDKFFSIGFDLPSLLPLDKDGFTEFFINFHKVLLKIYTLPLPTVTAIVGHAVAGGNILALSTDYRFMADGKNRIGLNEVNLGVPVPYLADMLLRQLIGDRAATEMQFGGELLSVDKAFRNGLVDVVFPKEEVEKSALQKVAALAGKPNSGFSQIKANRVDVIKQRYSQYGPEKNKKFLDCWYLPEVQMLLKKAEEHF